MWCICDEDFVYIVCPKCPHFNLKLDVVDTIIMQLLQKPNVAIISSIYDNFIRRSSVIGSFPSDSPKNHRGLDEWSRLRLCLSVSRMTVTADIAEVGTC